ncbi:hypothetical protein NC652_037355 [Populus alba x Populus x berolinensis]|nr:hypothetical protein NC652_037355 [Populus alba x Populus x berolinensis]
MITPTRYGYKSTLEAVSFGVSMVAMPRWTDQSTNAKYITDFLHVGVRGKGIVTKQTGHKWIVTKEDIEMCIKEFVKGESRNEIRRNSYKWKKLAKVTLDDCGSSDKKYRRVCSKTCMQVQRFCRVEGSICIFNCCKTCCRNQPNKLWRKIFYMFWFVIVMRRRTCIKVTINQAFIRFGIALLLFRNQNKALILLNMYMY